MGETNWQRIAEGIDRDNQRLEAENADLRRLHEPNEIADLRERLKAAEWRIERMRPSTHVVGWLASLTEGERQRTGLRQIEEQAQEAFAALAEPANAEGIASEGGLAQAANPDGFRADAPSAEAGQQKAIYERWALPSSQGGPISLKPDQQALAGAEDPWPARVQASLDALTGPDWQALAGELAETGDRLIAEYKQEEDEYGFPFNFALRQAHRDLLAALARYHESRERS